jgi:insertion element IS1 protein InsB
MIIEVQIRRCPNCGSTDMIKNGTDYKGSQKYHCHHGGGYGTLDAQVGYAQQTQDQVLKAYQERVSMRGIRRIFGVVPKTLVRWIKTALERLPTLVQTLEPVQADDVLELDELWSFVLKKSNKRWIWIALCRRTRQIVAYYVGDRSQASCRQLWQRMPDSYKACLTYSYFWEAYQTVFPPESHRAVGKETGQTAHVERWNNTLRQRLARFVRKTLSFSKSETVHEFVLRFFIINYNLQCSTSH